MDEEKKIDLFDPGTIMSFVMGVVSDFLFIGLIGLAIPGIGLAIAMFVLLAHYLFGAVVFGFFWRKTRGWLPKALLILAWILPLPLLTIGLAVAIFASNKVGAMIVEQVAIQAVALATAGAGEALEAGAVVAEGAEAAGAVAEGAQAAGAVAEGTEAAGAVTEGAQAAGEAAEGAEAGGAGTLEFPEEKPPMENLEKELTEPQEERFPEEPGEETEPEPEEEEPPEKEEPEKKSNAPERLKKVFDIADRAQSMTSGDDDEEEDDDSLAEAA